MMKDPRKYTKQSLTVDFGALFSEYQNGPCVATHSEKITHFEIFFSKCVKFGTSLTHFENYFQSALNLGPAQRTLKFFFQSGLNLGPT